MGSWGTEGDHVLLSSEEPPSTPRRLSEYVVAQEMPARAEFSRLLALIKKGRVQADVASDAASTQFGHSLGSRKHPDRPEVPVPLSAPGPIRTGDLQVRSLTLYPAELRAHGAKSST